MAQSDVGAIADAVSELSKLGSNVIDKATRTTQSYFDRLNEQGVPIFNNWFGERVDKSKANLNIIYLLGGIVVVIVIGIAFGGGGKKD